MVTFYSSYYSATPPPLHPREFDSQLKALPGFLELVLHCSYQTKCPGHPKCVNTLGQIFAATKLMKQEKAEYVGLQLP